MTRISPLGKAAAVDRLVDSSPFSVRNATAAKKSV
jgi:hypothetical protein